MWVSVRSSIISCFAGATATLWLYGAGSAWAGGGGEDLAGLNSTIQNALCPALSIPATSCPLLPTITQAFLEIAALANAPPEAVRGTHDIALGLHVDAGNPSRPLGLDPIAAFPVVGTSLTDLLPTLTPLAFLNASNNEGPAKPTQLSDPDAGAFLYAVANGLGVQPNKLVLFYEDLPGTNGTFLQGQIVAKISLPLVILNSNQPAKPETPVLTTLQISAACTGGPACLRADAIGGIGTPHNPIPAASLGVDFALAFSPSPFSTHSHAFFELQVPLVVTKAIDPPYFSLSNPKSFLPSAFIGNQTGFTPTTPGILPAGASVGVAPSAEPWQLPPAGPTIYALCASLPGNGNQNAPVPAVAAFYAIAADGETLLSAPLAPSGPPIVCPF
jgi:hypothetical protein